MARLFAFLLAAGATFMLHSPPANACSCFGSLVDSAKSSGLPQLLFVGSVVESGDSNVTAVWSRPPQPGLALRFEVDEVRVGEIGKSVVIHTPGGPANNGNCSVGVVTGQQLVAAYRDEQGFLTGGMCSIYPIVQSPGAEALTEVFGPAHPPSADIAPESLTAGVSLLPDPEDVAIRQINEEVESEPGFTTTFTVVVFAVAAIGAAGAISMVLLGSSASS